MNRRLKDIDGSRWPYVVVPEKYWRKYHYNAFVDEPQQLCKTLEEAERVQSSFERGDNMEYVVIKLK